ncbi:hypothetical protein CEXT_464491 [Caerostris extrusa]|uniref:Reverse transcriptase domain-containing protein n=1 Tax=Caerostris extrusa TaxID=172846 RepID=A0AAV4R195_CAEEX|nr:hypothetical protein CEXT_464491 [Caerostris extrusa]
MVVKFSPTLLFSKYFIKCLLLLRTFTKSSFAHHSDPTKTIQRMRKLRMQFGRNNASSTFKRFVDEITRGLKGVYSFSDGILITSKMHEDHIVYLSALFQLVHHYGLTLKPSKCPSVHLLSPS